VFVVMFDENYANDMLKKLVICLHMIESIATKVINLSESILCLHISCLNV